MSNEDAHWNCAHEGYTCADGMMVACKFNRVEVDAGQMP